jgi:hypothetical protein
MALTPRNSKTLQQAIRNFQDAVNKQIVEGDIKAAPSQANIQTALNTFKTALSNIGFTIS